MTRASHTALAVCTLALGSLAAQPATAQTGFEGVITYLDHNKATDKATQIVQTSKGHKAKFEGMGGASDMILIFDGDSHTMIMVQPDKKQYITVTQADMDQMAAMMKPMADRMKKDSGESKFKMDVTNTGRTETVAGTKCEVWHGTTVDEDGSKREGEACVAQGVGFALYDIMVNNPMTKQMRGSMQAQMEKFKQVLSGGKGVLKMTSIENGKPVVNLEATKIDRRPVSDTEFQPPAGYTGTSMAAMMMQSAQQMKALQQKQGEGKPHN
jgi:Domain of unknown function (DUF4412)